MAWKVLEKLKEKITGKTAEVAAQAAAAAVTSALPDAAKGGEAGAMPDLKELEKKGMLGQFFRHWKNPAFLRQVQALAARMRADGVDVKDPKAVQAWITAHQKEIDAGEGGAQPAKPETFVKSSPDVGRNDPCPCGSGKKYKKCHGIAKS
ncbi:MAG: SEC-C metal-binding domain-containing protein [Elusimicrobia bacterium]|nr:SEC-C metal-binding domain-containing protein [Elusimicrobiota bacterium]